jgi:hypothetical protein
MKKKYKEGINTFDGLLNLSNFKEDSHLNGKNSGKKDRYMFLKPLVHLYKGYG